MQYNMQKNMQKYDKYAKKYDNLTNMQCGSIMENMQENMHNMQNLLTMQKICKICTPHLADVPSRPTFKFNLIWGVSNIHPYTLAQTYGSMCLFS